MSEQAFHQTEIGESFPDLEASAVADEHYRLRCGFTPCRCTCRACGIRSLRYCEQNHMTTPKSGAKQEAQEMALQELTFHHTSAIDACPNCGREFLAGRDYPVGARLAQCRWCKAHMVIEPPKQAWRTRAVIDDKGARP